jgi:hypothetical protein
MNFKIKFGKKSILILSVALFWVTFVGITFLQVFDGINDVADRVIEDRKKQMNFLFRMSSGLLAEENLVSLEPLLKESQKLNLTDFFILQKIKRDQENTPETIFWQNYSGNVKELELNYVNVNLFIQTDTVAWKTIQIRDYKLTLGISVSKQGAVKRYLISNWKILVRDIFAVTAVLALILWLVLKDIISLTRALESGDRSRIKDLKGLSSEAQSLLNATQAYDSLDEEQKLQLQLYGGTVGPAIMHELKSGRAAPYTFETMVVRVDLNGYTRMFLDKKDEYVVDILNRYYKVAREIIERHSGLIYQYVGDEIVFHIKAHPEQDATLMALSCVRSLFQEAKKIEEKLPLGAGHQFRLKSAMSFGNLRFINLDQGHALTGVPLIESVRLLNNITSRDEQVVALRGPLTDDQKKIIANWSEQSQDLKGLEDGVVVCMVNEFKSFDDLFKSSPEVIHLLRTDDDVAKLIRLMDRQFELGHMEAAQYLLSMMKTWRGSPPSSIVIHDLSSLLKTSFMASQKGRMHDILIASLVMVIPRFVSKEAMTEELLLKLRQGLEHKNPRTVANTIVALSHYPQFDIQLIKPFFNHENNRVAADALYAFGLHQLNWEVGNGLIKMIESSSSLHQKSGEWVSQALLRHYGEKDPVFSSTNPVLKKLRQVLKDFEKIQKQAA